MPYADVSLFGAKGDGVTDDTAAFQAAINYAILINGTVYLPPPITNYLLKSSLYIQPSNTGPNEGTCSIRIYGQGRYQYIQYNGQSNSSIFVVHGATLCTFSNINVLLSNSVSQTVVFDIWPTVTYNNMYSVVFENCNVQFGTGGNNVAWRIGQISPTNTGSGNSDFIWKNCNVQGEGNQYGDIAWQIGGNNTIGQLYINCAASNTWRRYLNTTIFTQTGTVASTDVNIAVNSANGFSTLGFPTSGEIQINSEQIAYTGLTSSSFTGCTRGINGTTAASYGQTSVANNYTLSTPTVAFTNQTVGIADTTINVISTSGFPTSGSVQIVSEQISYTGTTSTSFTGCTRGINGTTAAAYGTNYLVDLLGSSPMYGVLLSSQTFTWIGGGGSHHACDFCFSGGSVAEIMNDRSEEGQTYLHVGTGDAAENEIITVRSCDIVNHTPTSILFHLFHPTSLRIINCNISEMGVQAGANIITEFYGQAGGSIEVIGGQIQAVYPFYTQTAIGANTWPLVIDRVIQLDSGDNILGYFASPARPGTVQSLDNSSPPVNPNPQAGEYIILNVVNTSAFTINAPSVHLNGARITFEIMNSSGSAMGTITWDPSFKLAGAFTNPANGFRRTISFVYNGSNWVEIGRAVADI